MYNFGKKIKLSVSVSGSLFPDRLSYLYKEHFKRSGIYQSFTME